MKLAAYEPAATADAVGMRPGGIRVGIVFVYSPDLAADPIILFDEHQPFGICPKTHSATDGDMAVRDFDNDAFVHVSYRKPE